MHFEPFHHSFKHFLLLLFINLFFFVWKLLLLSLFQYIHHVLELRHCLTDRFGFFLLTLRFFFNLLLLWTVQSKFGWISKWKVRKFCSRLSSFQSCHLFLTLSLRSLISWTPFQNFKSSFSWLFYQSFWGVFFVLFLLIFIRKFVDLRYIYIAFGCLTWTIPSSVVSFLWTVVYCTFLWFLWGWVILILLWWHCIAHFPWTESWFLVWLALWTITIWPWFDWHVLFIFKRLNQAKRWNIR